ARSRLDLHFDAIQQMEDNVNTSINNGYPDRGMGTAGMGGSNMTGMGGMGGTTGSAGASVRGGTTGSAGASGRGGTTGSAGTTGRGGTTGSAGTAGTGGGGGGGTGACKNSLVVPQNVTGIADPSKGAGNNYMD